MFSELSLINFGVIITGSVWIGAVSLLIWGMVKGRQYAHRISRLPPGFTFKADRAEDGEISLARKPSPPPISITEGTNFQPFVSVIVAARNEEQNLPSCLTALTSQDYPVDKWEIIVVDDHSTDRGADIVREWQKAHPQIILLSAPPIRSGHSPKKSALIAGLSQAKGEIILTTDADCRPPSGWIRGMTGHFFSDVAAVVGFSPLVDDEKRPPLPHSFWGRVRDLWRRLEREWFYLDSLINGVVMAGSAGWGRAVSAAGRNLAYRRDWFEKVGGFGESVRSLSGDDDLLIHRFLKLGGRVLFSWDKGSVVPSRSPSSLSQWWRAKRRHLSAGRFYPWGWKLLSAILYLFNLLLIAALIKGLWGLGVSGVVWAIWLGKVIVDGWALSLFGRWMDCRAGGWGWLGGELISPFLIALLVPLSLWGKVEWKGRYGEKGVVGSSLSMSEVVPNEAEQM